MKKFKIIALVIVTVMLCSVIFVGCSAKTEYKVTITASENGAVTVVNGAVAKGKTAELIITPASGYKLKQGSLKVAGTKTKEFAIGGTTFAMPAEDVTVKAEFEKETLVPVGQNMLITADGKNIYFGSYPQTLAKQAAVDKMGVTADKDGYLTSSYDGAKYAKVVANSCADKKTPYRFSDGSKIENGKEYFFKVQPIKWDVITTAEGQSMILTDAVVDSKAFLDEANYKFNRALVGNTYNIREGVPAKTFANNWEFSDIRAWLNDGFFKASFNDAQKAVIMDTTLNNSNSSYYGEERFDANDDKTNKFATSQKDTIDKVFLLSAKDVNNKELGFADKRATLDPLKMAVVTDYARCVGAWVNTNTKTYDVNGNGHWWLRSSGDKSGLVSRITSDGTSITIPGLNVYKTMIGVRPAMTLNFKIVAPIV